MSRSSGDLRVPIASGDTIISDDGKSKILEGLIVSGEEAVALQRYKASIKNDSKVA